MGTVAAMQRYRILDMLGHGTFGQVVKCQHLTTGQIVAVKVIKNKPAYLNQSMSEVKVLELVRPRPPPLFARPCRPLAARRACGR